MLYRVVSTFLSFLFFFHRNVSFSLGTKSYSNFHPIKFMHFSGVVSGRLDTSGVEWHIWLKEASCRIYFIIIGRQKYMGRGVFIRGDLWLCNCFFFAILVFPFARSFSDSTFRGLLAILEIFLGVCHQSLGGRNPLTLTKKLL